MRHEAHRIQKTAWRGEIWETEWKPSRGSEQAGIRPSLILQDDMLNGRDRYTNTIVLAMTRTSRSYPSHIQIEPTEQNGLSEISFVMTEQIMTIAKERLLYRRGTLTGAQMDEIEDAILKVTGLFSRFVRRETR